MSQEKQPLTGSKDLRKLTISTGKSRSELTWKNVTLTWEKLCDQLRTPKRTSETYVQYLAMTKDQQVAVKDVGGYVGGTIAGGRRVIGSCMSRSLLTLDVDAGTTAFMEQVCMLYGCTLCVTSTHKHSVLTPRYRLLIPLSREVLTDEYEAIARKVAGNIGIELFDPSTFQPERLMFWPSCSKDAEYVFEVQDGDVDEEDGGNGWLDPDKVLDEYGDWRDMSEWPVSKKSDEELGRKRGKQENPSEKGGMIGVFCRAYGVEAAIEKFLSDVYIKTDKDNRYTYALGSTSAGVVVYDDLFTFSHHGTDPTMGRLCNSFDLVRIHKFGLLDDENKDLPANKRPSFLKMVDLISKDPNVSKQSVSEQLRELTDLFNDGDDLDWTGKLETDKKGNVLPTIDNLIVVLEYDPNLKDILSYDDFDKRPVLRKSLPWREVGVKWGNDLIDADDANFRAYMEKVYGVSNSSKVKDAMDVVIRRNTFHPVRDYLKSIVWDGIERVDKTLVKWLGAEDTDYVRAVTRKTLVAAVKRVFEPGCKFDTMLTLQGAQGLGKSRWIKALGGKWFSDTFGSLANNKAMENIQGVWLMEIGELAGLKLAEVNAIKLFMASPQDRFRVAYGKRVETFPRQCIFIGTTNDDSPLHDQSGGRRFWIVRVTKKMREEPTKREVDQLWAEACHWYAQGEEVYLDDTIEEAAKEIQDQHTEKDERISAIMAYIDMQVPMKWEDMDRSDRQYFMAGEYDVVGHPEKTMDRVTLEDIWFDVIRGSIKDMTQFNTKFIRNIMNRMPGWEKNYFTYKNKGYRGWIRLGGVWDKRVVTANR